MRQTDRFSTRVFGLAVVAVLAYLLFRIFEPFLGPIFWAVLLAFLLFPLNVRLRKALRGRRGLAATIMTLAVTLGIAIPAAAGIVAFSRQAMELGQALTQRAASYQVSGIQDIEKLPMVGGAMEWLHTRMGLDAGEVRAWFVDGAHKLTQFLLNQSRGALLGALGLIGNVALTLFVLFFFFRDGDAIAERARRLVPLDEGRKQRLLRHLQEVMRAVVFGTVITAAVQGGLLGAGFWITGLPSPLVFGVLTAIASFIPLVGTGLVWVPATIYLAAKGVAWKAIFLGVWSALVVGSADNFLKPLFISGRAQIGTLTVLFGVLGGLAAFGMIGLFFGPVLVALVLALIEFAETAGTEKEVTPSESPGSPLSS